MEQLPQKIRIEKLKFPVSNFKFHSNPYSYVPRKCSATNRIIKAKDHASVQISIAKVDENGRYTGENQVYALCGFVRARGESDDSLNRLAQRDGFLKNVWSASSQRWGKMEEKFGFPFYAIFRFRFSYAGLRGPLWDGNVVMVSTSRNLFSLDYGERERMGFCWYCYAFIYR